MEEVVAALDKHYAWLESTGTLATRRLHRASAEIEAIAHDFGHGQWRDAYASSGTAAALADILVQNGYSEEAPTMSSRTWVGHARPFGRFHTCLSM